MKGNFGNFAFCVPLIASKPFLLPDHARPVQVAMLPLKKETRAASDIWDSNVVAIMHNVTTIHEIKTEIGYSRAWVVPGLLVNGRRQSRVGRGGYGWALVVPGLGTSLITSR